MENLTPKQTYSRFGGSYLLGHIAHVVSLIVICFIIKLISPELAESSKTQLIVNFLTLYIIGFPVMYMLIRNVPKTEIPKKNLSIPGFIACMFITYTLMYLGNIIALILNSNIGKLTGRGGTNPIVDVISGMSPLLQILVVTICAPVFEEMFFRKFLIDRIAKYGEVTAMLISGMMFGLFHGNLVQCIYASILGCFLAFVYIRTGRIIYTIILHCLVNSASTYLSLFFLKGIDTSEMMGYLNNGDMNGYLQFVNNHMEAFARVGLIGMLVILILIVGIILMIVLRKKFVFEKAGEEIEKGKRFSTAIINTGMLIFIAFWLLCIILTQLDISITEAAMSLISK